MFNIKKLICLSLIALSQLSFANTSKLLPSYSDLFSAVSQGNNVRAIMYMKKCSPTMADDAIAGMNFTVFNKYQVDVDNQKQDVIATSITMMTKDSQLGPVYVYVRLRIFADNTAEIYNEFLDPTTYKEVRSRTVTCKISNGHDENGVMLYNIG